MASYDLKCSGCGHEFELFVQGFLKEQHRVCPDCGGTEIEQLMTGFMMGSTGSSGGSFGEACASAPPAGCGHSGFG